MVDEIGRDCEGADAKSLAVDEVARGREVGAGTREEARPAQHPLRGLAEVDGDGDMDRIDEANVIRVAVGHHEPCDRAVAGP